MISQWCGIWFKLSQWYFTVFLFFFFNFLDDQILRDKTRDRFGYRKHCLIFLQHCRYHQIYECDFQRKKSTFAWNSCQSYVWQWKALMKIFFTMYKDKGNFWKNKERLGRHCWPNWTWNFNKICGFGKAIEFFIFE